MKENDPLKFESTVSEFNGIESFSEIATERFAKKMNGAEVVVDFDGVIADKIRMRNAQAQVMYESLKAAVSENYGFTSKEVDAHLGTQR